MRTAPRALLSAATAAVVALTAAACGQLGSRSGGDDDRAPAAVTVDNVRAFAAKAQKHPKKCPVAYDIEAAAKTAGLDKPVKARTGKDVADGELPGDEGISPDGPLSKAKGAWVVCSYSVAGKGASLHTVAAAKGDAVSLMLPAVQSAGRLDTQELKAFYDTAGAAKPGTAAGVPDGNVATVRLADDGKVAVMLAVERKTLTAGQTKALATALAGQL
ncbi:hypothetical protein SRB5_63810 [Streptomyces sp. RB5]|uniref:Lipoprotein n=1 Tax=Streptomyces smaragdinus TaxID=2585196 RepID=A0A7K0CRR4_9ACTN|nr:hypothetical protein [Streptomyces smaragdinus]MQY16185.1 hypothetical protein [Streptomyces smaragdinus]